jgi:hypothetical protein
MGLAAFCVVASEVGDQLGQVLLLVVSRLVSVAAFAWRFRDSSGVRRAQLRWMLPAALLNGLPQDLEFAASTVAPVLVAVIYAPLSERVRRWVNQVLMGRTEPYEAVSALARRLEEFARPEESLRQVAKAVSAVFGSVRPH